MKLVPILAAFAAVIALPMRTQAACPEATELLRAGIRDQSALSEVNKVDSEMSSVQNMSYDQLETYSKTNAFAADASYGLFDAGLSKEEKEERTKEIRARLSTALASKFRQEISKNYSDDKVSVAALESYQVAIAACAERDRSKTWGLHLSQKPNQQANSDLIELELVFRSPDSRVVDVEVTEVIPQGGNLIGNLVEHLQQGKLGSQPKTLVFARTDEGRTDAGLFIGTKTAGSTFERFPKYDQLIPPEDGDARWTKQSERAFANDADAVASQACFQDKIVLKWRTCFHYDNHSPATFYGIVRYRENGRTEDQWFHLAQVGTPVKLDTNGHKEKVDKWFKPGDELSWEDITPSLVSDQNYNYKIMGVWDRDGKGSGEHQQTCVGSVIGRKAPKDPVN